jgi:uncharacterized protein YggE
MIEPDVIHIEADAEDELPADGADLYVSLPGSSVVTGQAALKQAREVAAFAAELDQVGITEDSIVVHAAHVQVQAGLLTKSSSALFELRVRCQKVEQVADVLGALGKRKEAKLQRIEWRYAKLPGLRMKLLERCLTQAREKAELVAKLLGVRILGVRDFHEGATDETRPPEYDRAAKLSRSRAPGASAGGPPEMAALADELGLSVSHTTKVKVTIQATFLVGPAAS